MAIARGGELIFRRGRIEGERKCEEVVEKFSM